MEILIDNITMPPYKNDGHIKSIISSLYDIHDFEYEIVRKSLDARKKNRIFYSYRVVVKLSDEEGSVLLNYENISLYERKTMPALIQNLKDIKVAIIGSGPSGLFCALRLIEKGAVVEIFERGKPVEERHKDIELLSSKGILNEESNVVFVEGGAGTYSDGKLTTRINRPGIDWFYQKLVQFGAPPSILYEAKPHLGTDVLGEIIKKIRNYILHSGSKIHFNEPLKKIFTHQGRITGIGTPNYEEFSASRVILATGHSARDVYENLNATGATDILVAAVR